MAHYIWDTWPHLRLNRSILSILVGRKKEIAILTNAVESDTSELIALYGRRRIGKTYLVREVLGDSDIYFELTGTSGASLQIQLGHFVDSYRRTFGQDFSLTPPKDWDTAFRILIRGLSDIESSRRIVVFLDELPWLSSAKSNFIPSLEYFWNSWASGKSNIVVILCGSASSWILDNVIRSHGGLHNRLTRTIRLFPFKLFEVKQYFHEKNFSITDDQIAELYMTIGGIPHYLNMVEKGTSAAHNIGRICFSRDGALFREYENLFASLFKEPARYEKCIKALANSSNGLLREQISNVTGIASGGTLSRILYALEESGFITRYPQLMYKSRDALYKLTDEFCQFHHTWINRYHANLLAEEAKGRWQGLYGTPKWYSWSGLAFERLCLKHISQIKKAIGISGIQSDSYTWHHRAGKNEGRGTQIDLLIDRTDRCMNICEMKYSTAEYVISKSYAETLANREEIFRNVTGTKKTIFLTMVTSNGIKRNSYYEQLISNDVTLEDLFEKI